MPCRSASDACSVAEPASDAERLTALAQEARLLEFALAGDGDTARAVAAQLEGALTGAMDAESADELTDARDAIDGALARLGQLGMRLSAQLSDMELDGVLGKARMPVLTAVLSA